MATVKIAPSILAADFARLGQEIQEVASADQIHIDVMDGRFVPDITMGPLVVEAVNRVIDLPLDVHLMIVEPERHLEAFARAGADMITVHWEVSPNLHRTIQQIHELGLKAGVAINPHIPANVLMEILPLIDIVLVMTVNPGYGGQRFLTETLSKINQIRRIIDASGARALLSVDGGINAQTAPAALKAGANVFVAGSSIFKATDGPSNGLKALRTALSN